MGCHVEGSPCYNALYLACKSSPALSGRNQNNMPVSFSCRRPSWLQSRVQTRGEEEQVNVEGRSGGRVDKDRAQRKAATGMHKINAVLTACKRQIRNSEFVFQFSFCILFRWGHLWDEGGKYQKVGKSCCDGVKMWHKKGEGRSWLLPAAEVTIPMSSFLASWFPPYHSPQHDPDNLTVYPL